MAGNIHRSCERQKAYAWAKYFEQLNNELAMAVVVINTTKGINRTQGFLPAHITREFIEMADELKKKFTCPVCLDFVTKTTISITSCGHIYCKECVTKLKAEVHKCAVCRKAI